MKNQHLLASLLFSLLLIACTKDDPCEGVECQVGYCVAGGCNCPTGYSGTFCEIEDRCLTQAIDCQNGGSCLDGRCDCPEGFTGDHCEHPLSVQERLDAGETPQALFEQANIPLDSLLRKCYLGGIIAYINRDENGEPLLPQFNTFGILIAKEALRPVAWGCQNRAIPGLHSTSNFNGAEHTAIILDHCSEEEIAARLADSYRPNGEGGWHLPVFNEIRVIHEETPLHDLADYPNQAFWLSSDFEGDCNLAWLCESTHWANAVVGSKSNKAQVIPVKRF